MQSADDWKCSDPSGLKIYLEHAVNGVSIRSLAKRQGVHPSTISRRVRKVELRRDDPLVDEAIDRLESKSHSLSCKNGETLMIDHSGDVQPPEKTSELIRNLGKLNQDGSFMVVASDLEDAAIFRQSYDGEIRRTLVIGRDEAMVLALNDWVDLISSGRMSRYKISNTGRKALKRLLAEEKADSGFAEAPTAFARQHVEWGTKIINGDNFGEPTTHKANIADSPIALLARRKTSEGKPYLAAELVTAGERLREDFELAQVGVNITQNWESFLTGPLKIDSSGSGLPMGSSDAHTRFQKAIAALKPGLDEIALRCCCLQMGLEVAEKQLGYAARSGKVVLKIALQRLHSHYEGLPAEEGLMIG